jgi:tRNA (guanine37-N1)-methyltransferase
MIINIVTDFPEYFSNTFCSLFKRAIEKNIVSFNIIKIRDFTTNKHQKIDDVPFGGGGGMILKPEVIENIMTFLNEKQKQNISNLNKQYQCVKNIKPYKSANIITSPRGVKLRQGICSKLSKIDEMTILCNRYEGVDQRAIEFYNLQEVCVGDYILTGGETAAMCIIESVCRLIPEFVKNPECLQGETFGSSYFIQSDHYTKPRIWKDKSVPSVLLMGNHREILNFKKGNSLNKKRKRSISTVKHQSISPKSIELLTKEP